MDRSLDYLLPCIRQNAETIEVLCTGIVSVNAAMRLMYLQVHCWRAITEAVDRRSVDESWKIDEEEYGFSSEA